MRMSAKFEFLKKIFEDSKYLNGISTARKLTALQ